MGRRFAAATAVLIIATLALAAPAFAYDEADPPTGKTCEECHGTGGDAGPVEPGRKGPHGGYTTGTQKCQSCHSTHLAPSGYMLLPATTIKDTCNSCHDGTGGKGVYGVLEARGVAVNSAHRVEVTDLVPGGNPAGTDSVEFFSAAENLLTCSDCHSPHDSATVAPFTGDRVRESTPTPFPIADADKTNRLLKQRPTSAETTIGVYGSGWCVGCHPGRMFGSAGAVNHPVETETAGFDYENVPLVAGVDSVETTMGSLGGNNFGYVMPDTRTAQQAGHYPICQQCHEDARNVGDVATGTIDATEVFTVTAADGANPTDNPRFLTFPHESANARLLVEEADDLCLNCHIPPGTD